MKKIYTLLLAAALGATAANAQQTVFIGSTGYDDIPSAVAAAEDGATIVIKGDQVLSGNRIEPAKSLTYKGENGAKIIRGDKNTSNLLFLLKNDAAYNNVKLTFENIIFDGGNVETGKRMIEANKGTLTITGCTFQNCTFNPVITKTTTIVNNVKSLNTLPEGQADIYVGENNKVTLSGSAAYSVFMEKGFCVMQGENISGTVNLMIPEDRVAPGYVMVKNATDPKFYNLVNLPVGYELEAKDGNLVLAYNKPVVKNENTGVSYTSLFEAYNDAVAPEEGEVVLSVLESTTLTDRLGAQKFPIVIKGINADVVVKKTFNNKLFVSNNANLTFEDLVLDCNNANGGFANEFEANQNTLSFVNVKITNCNATANVFNVKEGTRTLNLDNCTGENITAPMGVNLNGKLQLNGNTNFNVRIANAGASITATGELTNEAPIEISFADGINRNDGDVIVNGTAQTDKFKLTNGKFLNAVEGNLVMSSTEQTGIEDVEMTANALVNVYNMQGVMVKENVDRANACAGLTPGLYVVGGKKTLVR